MQQQEFWPNNFRDGQKINASHFKAEQDAIIYRQAMHTASLLNEYNYGLLPAIQNNGEGVKLFLSIDNQEQVQVRLQQCMAITRGGYYIKFNEDTALHGSNFAAAIPVLSVPFNELKERASGYYVVITVDPYKRVPHGLADPLEQPARIPFTKPAYHLSLIPEDDATKNSLGLFQLPVGKLKIENQKVLLDEEYIPPCSSMSSHYDLMEIHAGLEQFYADMELYSLQIIQKKLVKKNNKELADIIQKLCENITILTASHLAQLKTLSLHKAPVEFVCMVSSFARTIKNTLDHYLGTRKEELINYCTKWCEVSQGELERSITTLSNHQYNHLDLNRSFKKISTFTDIISKLFANLARLDYVGERNDGHIILKEEIIAREPERPFRRNSYLAD